jgi:hypothetical protein
MALHPQALRLNQFLTHLCRTLPPTVSWLLVAPRLTATHFQLHAFPATSQAPANNATAQRLATTSGSGVVAPRATATKLGAATVAGSTATTAGMHSVVQPILLAQALHQRQQQLQVQQQQTAANTVDLTLDELSDDTTGDEEFPLLTPASCYGGQQSRVHSTTSSTTISGSNSARLSGRSNAMVRNEDVVASIKALSLSATSKVRCSIQHIYRSARKRSIFVLQ